MSIRTEHPSFALLGILQMAFLGSRDPEIQQRSRIPIIELSYLTDDKYILLRELFGCPGFRDFLVRALPMPIPEDTDKEKLAEIALAILWLGAHGDEYVTRVWKAMDWDLTDLLFEKGWISDPKNKSKSVALTEAGETLARQYFEKHFSHN